MAMALTTARAVTVADLIRPMNAEVARRARSKPNRGVRRGAETPQRLLRVTPRLALLGVLRRLRGRSGLATWRSQRLNVPVTS